MEKVFLEQLELEGGARLGEWDIEAIMAEYGKGKAADENTIAQLAAERDGLQKQLESANGEIQSYKDMDIEGIKAAAVNWEEKYNTDTAALKQELEGVNYGFAVKEATGGLKFTSESAKKAFLADLTAKQLPLQEGKLLGLEDFVNAYREADPYAFMEEGDKMPVMVAGGTGGGQVSSARDSLLRSAMGLTTKE